jgi:acetate---CoA ligase (ADP-forming)
MAEAEARVPVRSHRLEGLLNPRSVALVGASERNYFSTMSVNQLRSMGFDGALHVVNPRGGMIFGQDAVFDCKSIGEPVDAAYLCVPREEILKAARDAIDAGIRNLVVITAGFAEVGGEGAQLEAELNALCESNGVSALGPNCLGFRNILDRVGLGSIPFIEQPAPGTIALVTVSGSVANAVASYGVQQGIGFTHLISTGNEMNIGAADLVDYLVDIPEVKAITLFLEAIKDPAVLALAAERARAARKPIVALKAGSALGTAAIAAAHTSAVLGDDRVFDAACDRLGIIRVSTFEEMITTAAAIVETGPIRVPGVAVISMSGGVCEVASDYGAELGVVMPQFSEATRSELENVLSDLGQANNPLDLTGAAVRDESLWTSVTSSVSRDPAVGLILLNWEVPATAEPRLPVTLAHIGNARQIAATPTVIVASYERPVNEHGRAYLSGHGLSFTVPGLRHGMTAAAHLAWWSARVLREQARPAAPAPVTGPRPRDEQEVLAHLARYGVPVIPTRITTSAAEAEGAAREIGGRLAMKILSADISHKTEVGGVVLNVEGPDAAGRAFADIMRSVEANAPGARVEGVILAPMRTGGLEMLAGVARDPQWGLVLALGLGGIWVEVLNDTALCLLPADSADIARALRSTKSAKIFEGYRGTPHVDLEVLADAAVRIGDAAAGLGPDLTALEVNPLYVRGGEVEALDALATWQLRSNGERNARYAG